LQDPVTSFLYCLLVDYDFTGAHDALVECKTLLKNDFFLQASQAEFLANARLLMFKSYCRIHKTIGIKDLLDTLDLKCAADLAGLNDNSASSSSSSSSSDEKKEGDDAAVDSEALVVELIRAARVDARINSADGTIVIKGEYPSLYESVIFQTKKLNFRCSQLAQQVEKATQLKETE
jgi:translation initiation factor 3 subunit E